MEITRALLQDLYWNQGLTTRQMAPLLGLSDTTIERRMRAEGIPFRPLGFRKKDEQQRAFLQAYFNSWENYQVPWVIGYTWADGCIVDSSDRPLRGVKWALQRRDKKLLLDLKEELRLRANVTDFVNFDKAGNSFEASQLVVNISSLARLLADNYGIVPRKSEQDLPFPEVPLPLLGHFLRGFFEGDGSVTLNEAKPGCFCLRVKLLGTGLFLKGLVERLDFLSPPCWETHRNGWLKRVIFSKKLDVESLYTLMYPPGSYIHLPRKCQHFETFLGFPPGGKQR